MNRKYLRLAASLIIAPASLAVMAEITLPPLLTDNMVIQRDTEAPLWGTATPGATVTITPSWGKSVPVSTVADADGRWMTKVATPAAGGPYTITIAEGKTDRVTLNNVMSGEVWLCSGQSNMDMPLHGWGTIFDHEREIAEADHPGLRLMQVKWNKSFTPLDTFESTGGGWQQCAPSNIAGFSAAAYFFGRDLNERLGVPVGLIQASWGGTPAEAWISAETLGRFPHFDNALAALRGEKVDSLALELYHPKGDLGFYDNPKTPTVLYNAMIRPLAPYAIKGVIWYQGEDNVGRARQYRELLPALVADWERLWGQKFYFGIAQLANFLPRKDRPSESAWAELREAQMMTAQGLGDRGFIACLIDNGTADDIHPRDKQTVGHRLALGALRKAYRLDVAEGGPRFGSYRIDKDKVIVHMISNCDITYSKNGFPIKGVEIAGKDRVFHPADVLVMGENLIVSSPMVPAPVAVRYAWADNPDCNLIDNSGLPAYPFRTDDFPMLSDSHEGY